MTCGLFLILHHVLCVLAIDPGTSTECTDTPVCEEPGRYNKADTLLDDLKETFGSLNHYINKLNPNKCVFGVPAGKLLGYMVSPRGIQANPEKVQSIAKMQDLVNIKGIQQLTGRLPTLSCFISRLGERTLPFYQLL